MRLHFVRENFQLARVIVQTQEPPLSEDTPARLDSAASGAFQGYDQHHIPKEQTLYLQILVDRFDIFLVLR